LVSSEFEKELFASVEQELCAVFEAEEAKILSIFFFELFLFTHNM
jgi:hypothetical protein